MNWTSGSRKRTSVLPPGAATGRLRLRVRPPEAAAAPIATGRWIALDAQSGPSVEQLDLHRRLTLSDPHCPEKTETSRGAPD